ncbi:1957_t:CDS:2 [Entrophospora sp. SA101]|nr:1957_t:CDS:2 [Entrophospora sp. SA101]
MNNSKLDRFDPLKAYNATTIVKDPLTRHERFQAWMINEGNRKIFAATWILIHGLIFSMAFIHFSLHDNLKGARKMFGITYAIARSSAMVLHVDAAIILIPVCRNLVSLFRATPLNNVIPFDKNIVFHKAIGWSITFFTLIHTVAHWVNFAELAASMDDDQNKVILWLKINFMSGPGATGYVMLVCLIIMVITARESSRQRHYNMFWYLHHLCIPFFGVWAFHGIFCMIKPDRPPYCHDIASFWKYWIASGVIYIGERVLREIRGRHKTFISKVVMHPSKVVEIQIKKESIKAKAGQYIFLCCPQVSLFEWHPFTLTSAPEEDFISVHIRIVGDFTEAFAKKLGCDFNEEVKIREENKHRIKSCYDGVDISSNNPKLLKILPKVMIDGPFGSASEDVFKFEVSMLIGAGIGESTKLRKVYFFWICRDHHSFEWFQSLLLAIEEQDIEQFIEIHTYLTGKLRNSEVGNILVNNDFTTKDTITGLRALTHYGRPNWDKVFSNMRDKYPATDIGVFFCGPKPLGKQLHTKSNLWSQGFDDGTRFFYGKVILATSPTSKLENEIKYQKIFDNELFSIYGLPKPLLPISNKPAINWWFDASRKYIKGDIFIVTNALNYPKYLRWAVSNSIPRNNLINNGNSFPNESDDIVNDLLLVNNVKRFQNSTIILYADLLFNPNNEEDKIIIKQLFYNENEGEHEIINKIIYHNGDGDKVIDIELTGDQLNIPKKSNQIGFVFSLISLNLIQKYKEFLQNDGLIGNPSDGFFGKTISLLISNFCAEITLIPNKFVDDDDNYSKINLHTSANLNLQSFKNLESLVNISTIEGYDNPTNLIQATLKVFYDYCQIRKIFLHNQGFSIIFDTNIPRQVGLSGSSAIITAFFKSLMKFYDLTNRDIPLDIQPSLILSVEKIELSIQAGLQDRVIQVYQGLMYMNFDENHMKTKGYGIYKRIDINLLPKYLWIAYECNPSSSGRIHSNIRKRYDSGDQEVITTMKELSNITEEAYELLNDKTISSSKKSLEFSILMTKNFNYRLKIFGENSLGKNTLRMIEIANKYGFAAKFTGSGGCIVGIWKGFKETEDDEKNMLKNIEILKNHLQLEGFIFCWVTPENHSKDY